MAHTERFAALVILCGIALALITSLIIFVCCQLVYKVNKSRHRSKNVHRTVVFEHQTTTDEDNNGELFSSYCFEESTQSAQQGESEVHESPTPSPKHSPVQIKTSDLKGPGSSALPDVAKQKITSCNNNAAAALHGILTSSPLTPASVAPSSVVVTTASSQLSTLHHVTYHQKGPAVSQIESSISHTAAAPGVGRGSGGGGSVLTHSKQHQHQRLFAKQQDHRSKRFARSATLANAGYPGDPPSHHPGHHHHHHVVFASTSLEVLGVDASEPAAPLPEQQQPLHEKPKPKDNVIEMESRSQKDESCEKLEAGSGGLKTEKAMTTGPTVTNSGNSINAGPAVGISRQASVDVPEDLRSLTVNPQLSVKGESVDSSASERSPETIRKQYQELWQLRAEFEAEEKEKRSSLLDGEPTPVATSSLSSFQHLASSESYRSSEGRMDRLGDSGYKSLEERKDYSIDVKSEKIYRQFATPSLGSGGSTLAAVKPASAHPSIEEEDEEEDSEVVIFV